VVEAARAMASADFVKSMLGLFEKRSRSKKEMLFCGTQI
jgi:hypothetical protein